MRIASVELDLHPQNNCEVFLRLDNGNGRRVQINRLTTIKIFKHQLKCIRIQLPTFFQLVWTGKCIRDENLINETFESQNIVNKQIIHIQNTIPHSQREIKFDICVFYKGQKIVVKSKTEEAIMNLKEYIQEKNQTFSLDLIEQKDFDFNLLHPKIYEINHQEDMKMDLSTDTTYKMKKYSKNIKFEKHLGLGLTQTINPSFKLQ